MPYLLKKRIHLFSTLLFKAHIESSSQFFSFAASSTRLYVAKFSRRNRQKDNKTFLLIRLQNLSYNNIWKVSAFFNPNHALVCIVKKHYLILKYTFNRQLQILMKNVFYKTSLSMRVCSCTLISSIPLFKLNS